MEIKAQVKKAGGIFLSMKKGLFSPQGVENDAKDVERIDCELIGLLEEQYDTFAPAYWALYLTPDGERVVPFVSLQPVIPTEYDQGSVETARKVLENKRENARLKESDRQYTQECKEELEARKGRVALVFQRGSQPFFATVEGTSGYWYAAQIRVTRFDGVTLALPRGALLAIPDCLSDMLTEADKKPACQLALALYVALRFGVYGQITSWEQPTAEALRNVCDHDKLEELRQMSAVVAGLAETLQKATKDVEAVKWSPTLYKAAKAQVKLATSELVKLGKSMVAVMNR